MRRELRGPDNWWDSRVVYPQSRLPPRSFLVPPSSYTPKHRAVPAPCRPAAFAGPRHVGERSHPARKALRTTVTLTGLAAAATGVAVAVGVVQTGSPAVDLAGSFTPPASADTSTLNVPIPSDTPSAKELHDRAPVVSRSSDRVRDDRRDAEDPAKAAALGLSAGPAVSGREDLSAQDPQAIAEALLPAYGFDSSQMSCLVPLWEGESGWRWDAENPSSGAYGIPQSLPGSKMASEGSDWQTNPVTQIKWGLDYIRSSYGSPCGAWDFKQGHGWY